MAKKVNSRAIAANIIQQVINDKAVLKDAIAKTKIPDEHKAFVKELCFGVCRYYFSLEVILTKLVTKPIKQKDSIIKFLIMLGIYQLKYLSTQNYAAISETVNAASQLNKPWAKGLINATLRNFERGFDEAELADNPEYNYAHPKWLIDEIKTIYPNCYCDILLQNNLKAPLSLRVNIQNTSIAKYTELLKQNNISAVKTCDNIFVLNKAMPTDKIPGFKQGLVSLQDTNAALAVKFLKLEHDLKVLDACSAPGGKTCAILEQYPKIDLLALEKYTHRSTLIHQNLTRLKLNCEIKITDAAKLDSWWDGSKFDRVLLDAPCSATGIIRRQPDVKLHRSKNDITEVVQIQTKLLTNLWQTLNDGGYLLYATCSILAEENWLQIENFLQNTPDATNIPIETDISTSHKAPFGIQFLPGDNMGDGFYYCLLQKSPKINR